MVMKAARLHAYGELPVVEEVAEPAIGGPLDVIVRVGGTGLCRTDLHVIDGVFAYLARPLPYTLGHETAGWVHEVGAGVADLVVGDPVVVHPYVTCGFCRPCRQGDDQFCERFQFAGTMVDGGFAELFMTTARSLVKLGPSTTPVQAAGLADGGLAAFRAVKRSVDRLPPGSTVVVIGAGGLGHIAIQVLRAMTPAQVVAVDRAPDALSLATSVGAHVVILSDGTQVDAVRAATAGAGAEVVLDFVGDAGTPADAIGMLARRGLYMAVGYGGGLDVPLVDVVANEVTIAGSLIGTHEELFELAALAERGLVKVTSRTYPLDDIGGAMDDLRQGRIQGRAVIVP
jgi:NAD+-dependent secondary alcohol dehydrogenase Adh1